MAIVESKTNKMQESESNEEEIYYHVFPDMRRNIDYKNRIINFEINLPGVKKENIKLKVLPKWFNIPGQRGHIAYSANQSFGKEIIPEKTTAKYENGLLKITAYIPDPYEGAKLVEL